MILLGSGYVRYITEFYISRPSPLYQQGRTETQK